VSEIPNEKQAEKHTDPDEDDGDKIARKQVRKYIGHPPKRGHAPEGWHPPEVSPPYTPELPGVSSVRAAALTGETPRQGGERTPPLSGPGERTHSWPQLTMVLVVGPGVGVQ
jgi:hypothetical protein